MDTRIEGNCRTRVFFTIEKERIDAVPYFPSLNRYAIQCNDHFSILMRTSFIGRKIIVQCGRGLWGVDLQNCAR